MSHTDYALLSVTLLSSAILSYYIIRLHARLRSLEIPAKIRGSR